MLRKKLVLALLQLKEGEGTKRVSKESQLEELRKAITDAGAEVDEDILSKLTGKAASYFVKVLSA